MSVVVFALFLVLGAAAIALWFTLRFPGLMPRGLRTTLIHLFATLVLAHLVPLGIVLPIDASAAVQLIAGIFAVALPVLVYTFVVTIWLLRLAQNALGGMVR